MAGHKQLTGTQTNPQTAVNMLDSRQCIMGEIQKNNEAQNCYRTLSLTRLLVNRSIFYVL